MFDGSQTAPGWSLHGCGITNTSRPRSKHTTEFREGDVEVDDVVQDQDRYGGVDTLARNAAKILDVVGVVGDAVGSVTFDGDRGIEQFAGRLDGHDMRSEVGEPPCDRTFARADIQHNKTSASAQHVESYVCRQMVEAATHITDHHQIRGGHLVPTHHTGQSHAATRHPRQVTDSPSKAYSMPGLRRPSVSPSRMMLALSEPGAKIEDRVRFPNV